MDFEKHIPTLVKLIAAWAKVPPEQTFFGFQYRYPPSEDGLWLILWGCNPDGPKRPAKRMRRGSLGFTQESAYGDTPEAAIKTVIRDLRSRMKKSA